MMAAVNRPGSVQGYGTRLDRADMVAVNPATASRLPGSASEVCSRAPERSDSLRHGRITLLRSKPPPHPSTTRASIPVTFATAKLIPFRLRPTGTPGIGLGYGAAATTTSRPTPPPAPPRTRADSPHPSPPQRPTAASPATIAARRLPPPPPPHPPPPPAVPPPRRASRRALPGPSPGSGSTRTRRSAAQSIAATSARTLVLSLSSKTRTANSSAPGAFSSLTAIIRDASHPRF